MSGSLRKHLGAAVHDWPRFLHDVVLTNHWPRFHNRDERVSTDPGTGGVRCEWRFTSDLHLPGLVPSAGALLFRRASGSHPFRFADEPARSDPPDVSFVIGHRGGARLPHLLATIRAVAAQRSAGIECVVVEQSAHPIAGGALPSWVRHVHTPVGSDELPYNRSAAFNAGAAAARASVLVFHDNDMLVPDDYARQILTVVERGWDFVDLKRFIFYVGEMETRRLMPASGGVGRIMPERVMQNARGGSIAATREAFEAIGGFDEEFVGWGGEDNDFWERAETGRAWRYGTLPLVHLWHAPQAAKMTADPASGLARYHEIQTIPPLERIERILARRRTG